ncbi:TonB-dependent receptor plug domain-containing protein [Pelotalea chapellei]|uniref:TonB-dependent receptor plug domain-containing protein n=1 Tax=Pelotalea chapellei TaxID=44671 RepID=A0ABS5UD19_9BACT|nr:TonB-dependent receptor plug domain-containing protein [Pelotalea chapellei]MBT1073580.1 TonB-dependent receptor plug domain-containing protein [Pelotalea chapellei]
MKRLGLALLLYCASGSAFAAATDSIENVLDMEVTSTSIRPRLQSEVPAIISVITRDDIEMSGARDLVDLLRAQPGFEFGVDIWNNLIISFRGITVSGGRILVAVDGLPLPDLLYGSIDLSNRIPINLVERVEIIRGPGSVTYGNFAELAVVNIITKIGAETNKRQATFTSGFYAGSSARQNVELQYARPGENSYLGLTLFGGLHNRSDRTYVDPAGTTWNMQNDAEIRNGNLNLNLRYGQLSGRFMLDNSRVGYRDGYGLVTDRKRHAEYRTYLGDISYTYKPTNSITVIPNFAYQVSQPYRSTDVPVTDPTYYDPTARNLTAGLRAAWDVNDWLALSGGGQYNNTYAAYGGSDPSRQYLFPGGKASKGFERYSIFTEAVVATKYADVTAGLRYEGTDGTYNSALVPRVGLSRSFGDTHVKVVYNRAYRAPTLEQISGGIKAGTPLKTETADVYELELGHRLDDHNSLQASCYAIHGRNVISYRYDDVQLVDTYINSGRQGSRGLEAEYHYHSNTAQLALRYSFVLADNLHDSVWSVPGRQSMFIGIPSHKATVTAGYKITSSLSVNTTAIFTSERYGYASVDPNTQQSILKRFSPELYQDIYFLYKDALTKGLDLGVGVYDLYGTHHSYLTTYNSGHAPLPAGSREYLFKVSYTF